MVEVMEAPKIMRSPDASELLRQLQENMLWIVENRQELRKKYPDQFVAVDKTHTSPVIAHSKTLQDLKRQLKSRLQSFEHVAVDFVGKEELELILGAER